MGKYAAITGLAAANLYTGYRSARAGSKYYLPKRVVVSSKSEEQDQAIRTLYSMVRSNKPQISNWADSGTVTTPAAAGNNGIDWSPTTRFIASGVDYTSSVLGDYFRNHMYRLRIDCPTTITRARVIVYWSKRAGTTSGTSDFTTILDPAAFTVLYEKCFFPSQSINPSGVIWINVPLKSKLTNYNQSSGVLEYGQLNVRLITQQTSTSAQTITWAARLFVSNK